MNNKTRALVRIVQEICSEKDIHCTSFSHNWILKLTKDDRSGIIFGYNFGLNSSSSAALCKDKCAASEVLAHSRIPHIPHHLFVSPDDAHQIEQTGSWEKLYRLLEEYGAAVCKPNEGAGGDSVWKVRTQFELEKAAQEIFRPFRAMALSPYFEIKTEYRAVVLDGEVKLIYAKQLPTVTGDGKSSLFDLLLAYRKNNRLVSNLEFSPQELNRIPAAGEECRLSWKFNLAQGARPAVLEMSSIHYPILAGLARNAAQALAMRFCSVDIADTESGYRVMEVNSGVMMECFALFSEDNYRAAKGIYEEAILLMLNL